MKQFRLWWRKNGIVLVGLCIVTVLLWQWRFVRCGPSLLAENACESLTHWIGGDTINPSMAHADVQGMVLTKGKNQPDFSLFQNLERIENVRFLAVTVDAAWENAQPNPVVHWMQPRVVIAGYDANNRFCAPLDHGVVGAHGTRDWHRVQVVMELPNELTKARLSIDGFGEEGVLRLRNMRVEAVKQRAWFIPATIILLGLWALALSRILRPRIQGRWVQARSFAIACGILLGAWFFVFPQGRTLFPSLVGKFAMGPSVATVVDVEPTTSSNAISQKQANAQVTPMPMVTTMAPESRHSTGFFRVLRDIDRKWNIEKYNLTHFSAFLGIGLFVFGLAGTWRIWPLPYAVALLGEIVPNAIFDTWDTGDWWDLFANCCGLTLAMGLVALVLRLRRRSSNEKNPEVIV